MGQLRIPGPTPCPPQVLEAMGRAMINHRGQEFVKIFRRVTDKLKQAFVTKNDVLVLTGSGTGGLEAAVVNMLSPNDKVLSVSIGVFGDRFASIAKAFGVDVVSLKFNLGTAADPAAIAQALKDNPAVKAVLVTHNETSTGVTNDLGCHQQGGERRRKAVNRRLDKRYRRYRVPGRQLESGRGGGRISKRLDGAARVDDGQRIARGLEGLRKRQDTADLLGFCRGEEVCRARTDAMDAGGVDDICI